MWNGLQALASFAVLTNGSPLGFFIASRALQQGCPLAHFFFVLVVKGLKQRCSLAPFLFVLVAKDQSMVIREVRRVGTLKGVQGVQISKRVYHIYFLLMTL